MHFSKQRQTFYLISEFDDGSGGGIRLSPTGSSFACDKWDRGFTAVFDMYTVQPLRNVETIQSWTELLSFCCPHLPQARVQEGSDSL